MDDVITYQDTTEMFQDLVDAVCYDESLCSGESLSIEWLHDVDGSRLSEAERLNVILPLIKWCADNGRMTDDLLGELNLYHKKYIEGRLAVHPSEAGEVIRDLEESYRKAFPEG